MGHVVWAGRSQLLVRPAALAPALLLALAVGGCGYTSHYTPPADGRARTVWDGNGVVMEVAGPVSWDCSLAVAHLRSTGLLADGRTFAPGAWLPRYYGPAILVPSPGLAPVLPLYPSFWPHHRLSPHGWPHAGGSGGSLGTGGGGGGGGGGSGELGKAAIALAVVALAVLPVVDISLALSRPEDGAGSVEAISEVSAFNDLARQPGSPCAAPGEPGTAGPGGVP
jgi:hypothetical protein